MDQTFAEYECENCDTGGHQLFLEHAAAPQGNRPAAEEKVTARKLAERLLYTSRPLNSRTVARARWIGRASATVLLLLGLWAAATGTWQGTLIALYALTVGVWCWRYQRSMRGHQ